MERVSEIDGIRVGDKVQVTSFKPPMEGTVADMYNVPSSMVNDNRVKRVYSTTVPMIEVISNGKLSSFVKDVVKKIN